MAERLLIVSTHGREDVERVTIPFVLAMTTLASGMESSMLLQVEAVNPAKSGGTDGIEAGGMFPLVKVLMEQFLEGGGKLMVCNPSLKARGIGPNDLIPEVVIVNAPTIVQEMAEAKNVVSY